MVKIKFAFNGGSMVLLKGNKCLRCNHIWLPKKKNKHKISIVCPKCKSPYWNTTKKVKK